MAPMRRVRRGDDEGVVLLFVLAFVLVIAVIVGALLNQSYVNFRAARVAADVDRRIYAANGGIDWGIQQLRDGIAVGGTPACVNAGQGVQTLTVDPLVLNERTVTVTCSVTAGAVAPPDGWAVFVTAAGGGITTWPSEVNQKTVEGAVYNAGAFSFGPATTLRVHNGRTVQVQPACSGTPPSGLSLFPSPPYAWSCAAAPTAVPAPGVRIDRLPNYLAASPEDPLGDEPVGFPLCRRFAPGHHTTTPQFLPRTGGDVNYLRRGVYYFDNVGVIDITDAVVLGGARAPGETALTPASTEVSAKCPVETDGGEFDNYGVVLVLGGNSTLRIRGQSTVELHGYYDPVGGTDGALSILQLPASFDPGAASTVLGPNATLVQTVHGSRSQVVLHGGLHAPDARVSLFGTSEASVSLRGGIVAAALDLQARPGPDGFTASAPIGTGSRTIRLEATTNSGDGEKSGRAVADLVVIDDASRTVTVTSWLVEQ